MAEDDEGAEVTGRLAVGAGTTEPVVGAMATTGKLVARGRLLARALWKLAGYVVRAAERVVAAAADGAVTAKVTVTPAVSRWRPAAALATPTTTMLETGTLRYAAQTD